MSLLAQHGSSDCAFRIGARLWLVTVAMLAPGCFLDFSGLSDGAPESAFQDAGTDVSTEAPAEDASVGDSEIDEDGSVPPEDHADIDGAGDSAPDAGCALLSCGACEQPCPVEGCPPTTLATGAAFADQPRGLAVGSDGLYWVNQGGGQIVRLTEQSGGPEVIATADSPVAIAVGQGYVLWSERSGVFACQSSSCEATRHQLDSSLAQGSIRGLALDGMNAYWTDRGIGATTTDGAVRMCAVDSCPAPTDLATTEYKPQGLAVAADRVLWANLGDGFETGSLYMVDSQGGNRQDVAQALRLPTGVAADDTYVYFSRSTTDGRLYRCAFLEGFCLTPEDIAPAAGDLGHPFAVAIGGTRIWFATADDGSIRSCPSPGCGAAQPTTHVTGRAGLSAIAVGSTCLFWTDQENGGSVVKVAR